MSENHGMYSLQQPVDFSPEFGRLVRRKLLQFSEYRWREVHLSLLGALSVPLLSPLSPSAGLASLQFPHGLDQDVPGQSRFQQGPYELLLKGSQTTRPGCRCRLLSVHSSRLFWTPCLSNKPGSVAQTAATQPASGLIATRAAPLQVQRNTFICLFWISSWCVLSCLVHLLFCFQRSIFLFFLTFLLFTPSSLQASCELCPLSLRPQQWPKCNFKTINKSEQRCICCWDVTERGQKWEVVQWRLHSLWARVPFYWEVHFWGILFYFYTVIYLINLFIYLKEKCLFKAQF